MNLTGLMQQYDQMAAQLCRSTCTCTCHGLGLKTEVEGSEQHFGAFGIFRSVFAARFQRTKDRLHRTKTRWCNNGCKAVSSVVPPRDGWSTAHGIAPPGAQPPGRRTRGSGLRRSPLPRAVDHGVLFGHGPCHCGEHVECGFADPRPDLGRPILTYGPGRRAVAAFHRPHRELLVLLADSGTCRGFCV